MQGFFVLEGLDGSGKTTVLNGLTNSFPKLATSREPTDSLWGKLLRKKLSGQPIKSSYRQLFLKDRLAHNMRFIRPRLDSGYSVVLDRYYFSTAAYQGSDPEEALLIAETYSKIQRIAQPSKVIYLHLTVDQALKRIEERNEAKETFEKRSELERIYANYEILEKAFHFERVDAANLASDVLQSVLEKVCFK